MELSHIYKEYNGRLLYGAGACIPSIFPWICISGRSKGRDCGEQKKDCGGGRHWNPDRGGASAGGISDAASFRHGICGTF